MSWGNRCWPDLEQDWETSHDTCLNFCISVITSVLLPPSHNKCTKSLHMSHVVCKCLRLLWALSFRLALGLGPPTNRSPPASGRMRLVPSTSVQVFRWSEWKEFKEATPQSNNITEYNNWIQLDQNGLDSIDYWVCGDTVIEKMFVAFPAALPCESVHQASLGIRPDHSDGMFSVVVEVWKSELIWFR